MRNARHGLLGALVVAGALAASPASAAAPDPYAVSFWPVSYQDLPLPGGGPIIWIYAEGTTWAYGNFRDAKLPFPVRFFDEWFNEAAVGSSGYLSFGPVSIAGVPSAPNFASERENVSIPPTLYGEALTPSRIIALWWDDIICGPGGTIRAQVLGQAPNRQYVIEWRRCNRYDPAGSTTGTANMQLWLTEGSGTLETRYGKIAEGPPNSRFSASVGVMSPFGETIIGYPGLPCTPSCGPSSWVEGRAILYSQEADLALEELSVQPVGHANLPLHVELEVQNHGVRTAPIFSSRLWLSPSPELVPEAVPLATLRSEGPLPAGAATHLVADPLLPLDLEEGERWLLAELNPDELVVESTRRNNLRALRITVAEGTPDLAVGPIVNPEAGRAGEELLVKWVARNLGGARAEGFRYSLRLSASDSVSVTDRELHQGRLSLERFSEQAVEDRIALPADLLPGVYWIGIVLDPGIELVELSKRNNDGVGDPLVILGGPPLQVLTRSLPAGELGAPWCKLLEARGGDGAYVWSVAPGSSLPPGLILEEIPAGARAAGLPFSTRLCGRPTSLGAFEFVLEVSSALATNRQALELEVLASAQSLTLATTDLPTASVGSPYSTSLGAIGGRSPYRWELIAGQLPQGLELDPGGGLAGIPTAKGTFSLRVRVIDAAGSSRDGELNLFVGAPGHLMCPTMTLPLLEPGAPFHLELEAIGGRAPFTWATRSTTELGTAIGERSRLLGASPPPGLELDRSGTISGSPSRQGRYLWMVEVRDAAGVENQCTLSVEVGSGQTLAVSTMGLLPAVVGRPYAGALEASGGRGSLEWTLLGGSRLPAGLSLASTGAIEGIPEASSLEGDDERSFAFVVEVRDAENRRGLGAVSISLLARPVESAGGDGGGTTSSGGCAAGIGSSSLWWPLVAAGLLLLRRSRAFGSGSPSCAGSS